MRVAVAAAAALAAGLAPAGARAAPCGRSDLVEAVPPDGATGVAINAAPEARYASTAEYLGEPVKLVRVGGETKELVAEFEPNEARLQIKPPDPFEPGASYEIHWPELRGKVSSEKGRGKVVRFTAGRAADDESPRFEGLRRVSWDLERRKSGCDEDLVERYTFAVDLSEATDDGGRAGLTLIVFQSKGPRVGEAPRPVLTAALPAGPRAVVALAREDAVGHVCFSAIVRDLAGRTSAGGAPEVCAETIDPPFFSGCAVVAAAPRARAGGGLAAASLAGLIGLGALRARRRRGTP